MTREFYLHIDLEHPDAQKYGAIASILQSAASHFISDIEDWSAAPEDSHGTIRTLHGEPGYWEITGVTKDPRDVLMDQYLAYVKVEASKGAAIMLWDEWRALAEHEEEVERQIEDHEASLPADDEWAEYYGRGGDIPFEPED